MNTYFSIFINKKEKFFISLDDEAMLEPLPHRKDGLSYFDLIANQIRHIMYHVGYCECFLREKCNIETPWISIYGKTKR